MEKNHSDAEKKHAIGKSLIRLRNYVRDMFLNSGDTFTQHLGAKIYKKKKQSAPLICVLSAC